MLIIIAGRRYKIYEFLYRLFMAEIAGKIFAENVVIRHVCDCAAATEHPAGEAATEHVLTLDGVEFPWHITKKGPVVARTDCGYTVTVEIMAQNVDAVGVPIHDSRNFVS
jgi:hypothetical protein